MLHVRLWEEQLAFAQTRVSRFLNASISLKDRSCTHNANMASLAGTLTQNKMTVIKFWLGGKMYDQVPEGKSDINEKLLAIFAEVSSIMRLHYDDDYGLSV